ncbi:hypothetical protein COY27_05010 [Candidatus Woesearchaeota archaeon CG_4_10_14_0_2_um_filter_33_13]|nr:MAG: hypothetical protein COY27_05010 [Candidatus Woesearchaeota archaeon CG_4_10_14_0_2_um_filter_33_13]
MDNVVRNIRGEFHNIRQALDEHLSAINGNTTEIQSLFDYLQELDVKIEKLSQRLDGLQLSQGLPLPKLTIQPLNQTERKLFLVLYTEEAPLSFREIAERANVPNSIIPDCISALAQKGIPLSRTFCNEQLFIKMDPVFKEIQAKENIVNLSLESFM